MWEEGKIFIFFFSIYIYIYTLNGFMIEKVEIKYLHRDILQVVLTAGQIYSYIK